MLRWMLAVGLPCCLAGALGADVSAAATPRPIRVGIIGLDTSHVPAFTKLFNDPNATGDLAGFKVSAAFPGGSDIPASRNRVKQFTEQLRAMGVEIVDSIPALLAKVDVVLLESVDGRPHLEQARPVFEAGKPIFIDKPLAGSLADAVAIVELGRKHNVPWFSSSSLRFSPEVQRLQHDDKTGDILGCNTWGPCPLEPTHPDLYWYGIHGVETLFTLMGPQCESVSRVSSKDTDVVIGVWSDGRIGSFRGLRAGKEGYGATVFGSKAIVSMSASADYKPLVEQIARFFKTRKPPVSPEETLAIMAFMEAADESKRHGGAAVKVSDVLEKARSRSQNRSIPSR